MDDNTETIKVPLPDEFKQMSEKELYDFLLEQHESFLKEVASVCLRGAIPQHAKDSAKQQLAKKFGLIQYNNIWLQPIRIIRIPQKFINAIKKHGQKKSITTEVSTGQTVSVEKKV
jgi:hypothetical protein